MAAPVAISPPVAEEPGSGPSAGEQQAGEGRQCSEEGVTHSLESFVSEANAQKCVCT